MNETVSFEAISTAPEYLAHEDEDYDELDDQNGESRNSVGENIDDDPLTSYIASNATELVECPWLDNSVVTLSTAALAYSEKVALITAENIHVVASILQGLRRVKKTEETEEGNEAEEEGLVETEKDDQKGDSKTEIPKEQARSNTADTKTPAKKAIDETKSKERSATATNAEITTVSEAIRPAAPKATAVANSPPQSSAPEAVINGTDQESSSAARSVEERLNETEPIIKPEFEDKQPTRPFETAEADVAVKPFVEAKPAPEISEIVADQEIESIALPVAPEATAQPEATELSLKSAVIPEEITELAEERTETTEDVSALTMLDYQPDSYSPVDFEEEVVVQLAQSEAAGEEPGELAAFSSSAREDTSENLEADAALISQFDNNSTFSGQIEFAEREQPTQISLTIEEIEDSLIQLGENIEASAPATTKKVNEILDKIIDVSAKLESHDDESITETQAQEELEELFTQLFDKAGVEHTPELIESLASLTLRWRLADEIEKLKNEEETDKVQQGSGTHEIIKKLLKVLSTIKKAIVHAGAIGKSALRLYSVNFAT